MSAFRTLSAVCVAVLLAACGREEPYLVGAPPQEAPPAPDAGPPPVEPPPICTPRAEKTVAIRVWYSPDGGSADSPGVEVTSQWQGWSHPGGGVFGTLRVQVDAECPRLTTIDDVRIENGSVVFLQPATTGNTPSHFVGTEDTALTWDGPADIAVDFSNAANPGMAMRADFWAFVENTPPEVFVQQPVDGGTYTGSVPIDVKGWTQYGPPDVSAVGLSGFAAQASGELAGTWQVPAIVPKGPFTLSFQACDWFRCGEESVGVVLE